MWREGKKREKKAKESDEGRSEADRREIRNAEGTERNHHTPACRRVLISCDDTQTIRVDPQALADVVLGAVSGAPLHAIGQSAGPVSAQLGPAPSASFTVPATASHFSAALLACSLAVWLLCSAQFHSAAGAAIGWSLSRPLAPVSSHLGTEYLIIICVVCHAPPPMGLAYHPTLSPLGLPISASPLGKAV